MSLMSLSPCAGEAPSVTSGDSTAEMVVRAATAMPEAPMSLSKIVQAEIEDETSRSCMSAVDQAASGVELPSVSFAAFMILQHEFQHAACSRQVAKMMMMISVGR
eukprot:s9348_g1.t1